MTYDLDELGATIHRISTEHGFEPPDLTNLPEKLMLSVSELAECLEEHRSGKALVYYEYSRDQRHMGVEVPEVIMEDDEAWYMKDVEVDVHDFMVKWIEDVAGRMEIPSQYYTVDGRWKTMDSVKTPYRVEEWAAKGAFDKKPEGILVEIADSIIRNLHMMHSLIEKSGQRYSIENIVLEKMEYNDSRPAKHGRAY